jgi:hypothetical protein
MVRDLIDTVRVYSSLSLRSVWFDASYNSLLNEKISLASLFNDKDSNPCVFLVQRTNNWVKAQIQLRLIFEHLFWHGGHDMRIRL